MTRVDHALPGRPVPDARGAPERTPQEACRRFAHCVSRAERCASDEAVPDDSPADGTAGAISAPVPGVPHAGGAVAAPGRTDPDGPQAPSVDEAEGAELGASRERWGPQEGLGAMTTEPGRPQALATRLEAPPSRGPDTEAAALARSLLRELPLSAARERTLTVSFPATAGAVERIVMSTSGGVVSLVVTARAPARDRVAAALPELAKLLRARGVRVGSVGLD
jgi:hypothetical protein